MIYVESFISHRYRMPSRTLLVPGSLDGDQARLFKSWESVHSTASQAVHFS